MKRRVFLVALCACLILSLFMPVSAAKAEEEATLLEVTVNTYSNKKGTFGLEGLYRDNVFYILPEDICTMTGSKYQKTDEGVEFSLHHGLRIISISEKGVLKESYESRNVKENLKVVTHNGDLYISAPDILSYMGAVVAFSGTELSQLHMMVSMPYTVMDLVYDYGTNGGYFFSWAEAEGKLVDPEDVLELAALDTVLLGYDSNALAYALPGYSDHTEKTIHADALLELLRTEGVGLISQEAVEVEILGYLSDHSEVSMGFIEKTMEWVAEGDIEKALAEKWSSRMDATGFFVDMTAGCIASLESAKQFANLSATQKALLQDTLCRVSKNSDLYKKHPSMFEAARDVEGLMTGKYSAGEKAAWDSVHNLLGNAVEAITPPNPISFAWDTLTGIAKIDPLLEGLLEAERNITFASECSDIRVLVSSLLSTDLTKFDQNGGYLGRKNTAVQEDIKQDIILSLKASLTSRLLLLDTGWLTEGAQNTMQMKAEWTAELLNMAQNARPVHLGVLEENEEDISFIEKLVSTGSYGNVVNIYGNTYYWRYDADSFNESGYAGFGMAYETNTFVCRNQEGEEEELFTLNGSGPFVIAGRQLFYCDHENQIRSIGLDGTNHKTWGDGQLCAVTENGKTVIFQSYQGAAGDVNLYAIDVAAGTKRAIVTANQFVAYHDGFIYFTKTTDREEAQMGKVVLHRIRPDGTEHKHLYTTAPDLYDYGGMYSDAFVDQIRFTENYIYFSYGCIAGSGMFFQGGKIARVRYDGTGGEIVAGQDGLVDGQFTVSKNDVVSPCELEYTAMDTMGNPIAVSRGYVYRYDEASGEPILMVSPGDYDAVGSGLAGVEANGTLIMVAFVEESGGKVYYMMHYAVESDYENISWREEFVRVKTVLMVKDRKTGEVTVLFQC